MTDTIGAGHKLTYGQTLTAALALAREIGRLSRTQDNIGILFPASVGGALINLAVLLQRRVAINLNFTVSAGVLASSIRQAGIETIISSREFMRKFPALSSLPGLVFLEDILPVISRSSKIIAWLKARFAPVFCLGVSRVKADDLAAIIFSSGTTGEPKGIMLSHHNILSNVDAAGMVFRPQASDRLCGTLPFFHSFGYTCCLFLPLLTGVGVYYHPNPLEGGKVAEVIRENLCTAIFTTPTFLLACLRRGKREDFKTLRLVVVGAEKLKKRTADAFEEHFGIRPLEGYGATELAPVVSLGLPDIEVDGFYQAGSKPGSVGQPLPGIAAKIVDPETGAIVPFGQNGLLLVKGPNVMLGYLNRPDLTAQVIIDGWYRTGDIAQMDADGFITITDRLSRFSKIGGEMVPHLKVEEKLHELAGVTEQCFVVTGVPDEKKGERLVVLHTLPDATAVIEKLVASDLPNLWKPKADQFHHVEALPYLGTGKLDLRKAKELAASR
jgi:acyl-[acyl-carrier-protein]-phospholipid O-acyltransferase/long-chain-fatty-acid--[acyl-carrier-protein] ligase